MPPRHSLARSGRRAAGVLTCPGVRPALPMDVDRMVARVAPLVSCARVDRMKLGDRARPLYRAAGCAAAASDEFFTDTVGRLRAGFAAAGVAIDELDDMGAMIGP